VEPTKLTACFLEQARDQQRWRGIAFGGLEHEGVAAGQRHREHPHRHHAREVERGDAGDHTERGVLVVRVNIAADIHRMIALEQMRDAAGEFHHFDAAGQLAARIAEHFAVLGGDQPGHFIGVCFEQFLEAEHHARAQQRRGCGPGRECFLCGAYCGLDFGFRCQRYAGLHLAAGGIVDVAETAAAAGGRVAVDEVGEGAGSGHDRSRCG